MTLETLSLPGIGHFTERLLNGCMNELHPRHGIGEILSLGKPSRLHHPNSPTLFCGPQVHRFSNLGCFAGRSSRGARSVVEPPILELCDSLNRWIGGKEAVGGIEPPNQEPVEKVTVLVELE